MSEVIAERLLRSQLGSQARPHLHSDRGADAPMSLILLEAERRLNMQFLVYLVEAGPPDCLSLQIAPRPVVAVCDRYLSIAISLGNLFVESYLSEVAADVTERSCLALMAEVALRDGDPDFAATALAKSLVGRQMWIEDGFNLLDFALKPVEPAYLVTGFYALLHEIGHFWRWEAEPRFAEAFAPAAIQTRVARALRIFSGLPDDIKAEARRRCAEPGSHSILETRHLANEAAADAIAASILLGATDKLMRKVGRPFIIAEFVCELVVFMNCLALFERCRKVAQLASLRERNREAEIESALHPVAMQVRAQLLHDLLVEMLLARAAGESATDVQRKSVAAFVTECFSCLAPRLPKVEAGLAAAMRFGLYPGERQNEWQLLDRLRCSIVGVDGVMIKGRIRTFLALAEALDKQSKLLDALGQIADHPDRPVRSDPSGDIGVVVPWVDGPKGFSRPFGLDTKYGHLVFVFSPHSEIFEGFCRASAETLKSGFAIREALLVVPCLERIGPELAPFISLPFQVVVEGCDPFDRYLAELVDDTIWQV